MSWKQFHVMVCGVNNTTTAVNFWPMERNEIVSQPAIRYTGVHDSLVSSVSSGALIFAYRTVYSAISGTFNFSPITTWY